MRITSLILVWIILAVSFFSSGCGNNFKKAYKTSRSISNIIATTATTVGDLYTAKLITFEVKENIVNKLKFIQKNNEEIFLKEIDLLWNQYKTGIPKDKLAYLDAIFNRDIVNGLLDLLNYVGAVGGNQPQIMAAFVILKAAIYSIAAVFGSSMASLKLGESKSLEAILPVMDEESLKLAGGYA